MNILSLGAGVQSSTVLLMSCRGVLPKLDGAIFADTQWEPKAVYEWLRTVLEPEAKQADIPIYDVSAGNIRQDWTDRIKYGDRAASIPFFTEPGDTGEEGRLGRQCTKEYKIEPIQKLLRDLCDAEGPDTRVRLWYGISGDEMRRMRVSQVRYIENYYPLIFGLDRPYHRHDCVRWLGLNGFPVAPRSACIGCPNHNNDEWRLIRERPDEWRQAIEFDTMIRQITMIDKQAYVHRSCQPLGDVDLSTPEERGQQNWLSECEGGCGV
jgi:hypothetical protein